MGAQPHNGFDFERLFTELRAPVFKLCYRLLGDRLDAEDAVQETFWAVHRALPGFRGDAALSTWVYRIAIRTALHLRARREPRRLEVDGVPLADAAPLSDVEVAARQEARRLQTALDRLPAEQRLVLTLSVIDEVSHRDIAAILGIPEGTVGSRLHTARKRLFAEMNDEGADANPTSAR